MKSYEIWKKQVGIIVYIKEYLKLCKQSNINIANSSFCYFAHWGFFPGSAKLRLKLYGLSYILNYTKIILFNILGISKLSNYFVTENTAEKKIFKNLIISNASKQNFRKDGSYFDSYFQTNSRKLPNTLWFLNSVDNHIPNKFDKNIIIFARSKSFFNYNFLFFMKIIFKVLVKSQFSLKKIIHELSVHSQFSNIISKKILSVVESGKFKNVINSYEAQPFQNTVFNEIKKINKKVKTIGYWHTPLAPISTSSIFKSGAPDLLLISGKYSKVFLCKYLSWPKKRIQVVPSFRYNKKNLSKMGGYIYLPFNIFDRKKIILEFENFLKTNKINSINKLTIKDHPFAEQTYRRKKTIKQLKNLIEIYKSRFNSNKKKKLSVFIGATSSVIVALEANIETVHICEEPIFESYSGKLWKTLKVEQINNNTFIYKQKIKNSLIKFGLKDNMLQNYVF